MSIFDHKFPFLKIAKLATGYRTGHEKSFRVNRVKSRKFARERFAVMLVTAFRGETPQDVANNAAESLGVSSRQVMNWLKGESSPAFEHVVVVGTVLGIWKTMEIMCLSKSRDEVARMIQQ